MVVAPQGEGHSFSGPARVFRSGAPLGPGPGSQVRLQPGGRGHLGHPGGDFRTDNPGGNAGTRGGTFGAATLTTAAGARPCVPADGRPPPGSGSRYKTDSVWCDRPEPSPVRGLIEGVSPGGPGLSTS
ncbi:hypothetical protein GCM10009863_12740 [Streptomyces axinellae]|uniref:Uncharacterized protein n=1 Tax=Streptomyces axinellae TaxID=552788 RepID=A0ABN3PXJ6_9ACTN